MSQIVETAEKFMVGMLANNFDEQTAEGMARDAFEYAEAFHAEAAKRFTKSGQKKQGVKVFGPMVTDVFPIATPYLIAEMKRYLPILEKLESRPDLWGELAEGTGIETANGYRHAIERATKAQSSYVPPTDHE